MQLTSQACLKALERRLKSNMSNNDFRELYKQGIIVITSSIGDMQATSDIILSMLNWSRIDPKKELQLYISSTSNDYLNVLSIYDAMQSIKNPLSGYAIGLVGGCSSLLLAACNKGKRYILEHSQIAMSELRGVISSGANQQTEVEIIANELASQRETFEELLSKHTSLNKEEIHKLCYDNVRLNPEDAIKMGFVDKVVKGK